MRWYAEISRAEKRALWSCFAGWGLDGVDTQLFSLVIPTLLTTWGIGKGEAGLIGGATLVAGALGGLLAGTLSDRFGRVRTLQITVVWFSLFTFLSAFAQNFDQLLALKALQGLGFGGEWTAGAVLLSETINARHRGKAMGIVQSCVVASVKACARPAISFWFRRSRPGPDRPKADHVVLLEEFHHHGDFACSLLSI
jgi:MFS family permease